MKKEIEAKPKHMDEIDYMLNELNSTDDKRVNVTKTQIKAKYTALFEENIKLKRQLKIIKNMYRNEIIANDTIYDVFDRIIDGYIEMSAEKGGEE